MATSELPEFHPLTLLRDWGGSAGFRLADALTGVAVFGATGSGKTSGPAKHLAYGYLGHGFGGIVLCAKREERLQWEQWAADTGRTDDLVIVESGGKWCFNPLAWEAERVGPGGGYTINVVALLDEIAGSIAGAAGRAEGGGAGDAKFFNDALHYLNTNVVDLIVLAGYAVTLPLMRAIVTSAPLSKDEVNSPAWEETECAALIALADKLTSESGDTAAREDFEECRNYWTKEFPNLSERTRSIIVLSFSMLVRPLITRPLKQLFSTTNVIPENTFDGKVIIVDLPVQAFRLAGKVASLLWKFCFQVAVMRRSPPSNGYLRPVFLWADEAQNFVTEFDAEYQAVARSAAGCTVYLTQNRESYRRVLNDDDAVDSLLGNLQAKFFCQNSSIDTNEFASKLLGEHYVDVMTTNVGQSHGDSANQASSTGGVSRKEEKRPFVEPSVFTTLKRGGAANKFQVETIVYNGGYEFQAHVRPDGTIEHLPYRRLTFNQR